MSMSERERLIELIGSKVCEDYSQMRKCYVNDCRIGEFADDLLANGVIVPPCKVGDVVYSYLHPWCPEDGIVPYQITNITITQNKRGLWIRKYRAMQLIDGKTIDRQLNFSFDDIGKTVFSTEEAVMMLKGGKSDE